MKYLTIKLQCNDELHERYKHGTTSTDYLKENIGKGIDRFFAEYPTLPEESAWGNGFTKIDET